MEEELGAQVEVSSHRGGRIRADKLEREPEEDLERQEVIRSKNLSGVVARSPS